MADLYWDPIAPELRDDPYPLWRRMRDEAPVYRNDRFDFYALSRFDDIDAAHRDPQTYSSNHGTTLETMSPDPIDTGMIIWLDPPKHTVLRKLVSGAFTRRRVTMLEDRIRSACADLLDPHVGSAGFDYVQDFSAVLPPTVISMLLGVPPSEREELRRCVDDVFHIDEGVGMANDVAINALAELGERLGTHFRRSAQQPARRCLHRFGRRRGHR
jgi:cytochrome P450